MTRLGLQSPDQVGLVYEGSTRLNTPITLQRGPQGPKNELQGPCGIPTQRFWGRNSQQKIKQKDPFVTLSLIVNNWKATYIQQ